MFPHQNGENIENGEDCKYQNCFALKGRRFNLFFYLVGGRREDRFGLDTAMGSGAGISPEVPDDDEGTNTFCGIEWTVRLTGRESLYPLELPLNALSGLYARTPPNTRVGSNNLPNSLIEPAAAFTLL